MIFLLAYDSENRFKSNMRQVRQGCFMSFARQIENEEDLNSESELKVPMNYVFRKAHNKYLSKFYRNTEPFGGIFNDGSYNCVSGTALVFMHI
jgi:hypothetical protein